MALSQLSISFTAGNLNLINNLTGSIDVSLNVLAQKIVPNIAQLLQLAQGIGIDIPLSAIATSVVGAGRLRREERGLQPWDLDDDNGFGDAMNTDPRDFDLKAVMREEEEELEALAQIEAERENESTDRNVSAKEAARYVHRKYDRTRTC